MAENDGELSFEPNQIITNGGTRVTRETVEDCYLMTSSYFLSLVRPSHEPGWLEGTLHGKSGLIPENYVEVIP